MHIFLLFSVILATVFCAPVTDESQAKILFYEYNNDGSGNYNFRYSTSNGIFRQEHGILVNRGEPNEHIKIEGLYNFSQPDGSLERIEYTADENGFHFSRIQPVPSVVPSLPGSLVAGLLGK